MDTKKKIIRLKERDIVEIVNNIISEQIGDEDNALASIKPAKDAIIDRAKTAIQQKLQSSQINQDIVNHKNNVRESLQKLMVSLNGLIQASGINPDTNNLTGDIQKVSDKFEQLFGDPTPEPEDDKVV